MKNIITIILTLVTAIFLLSGCSGRSSSTDNNDTNGTAGITMPSCGTGDDMGKSVAIAVNGKTIEKTQEDAEVRIWHYPDGNKFGCMITGEAILISN